MDTTSNTKPSQCSCIIRHPVNAAERTDIIEQLRYSRSIGDTIGIMLAMTSLQGKCPSSREEVEDMT